MLIVLRVFYSDSQYNETLIYIVSYCNNYTKPTSVKNQYDMMQITVKPALKGTSI